ncbi:MAG: BglII/BstYI family type II restriction endonuclease [Sulfurovum sp.]|nr:BglII/BstYI family type II restriction endonuclease [Sulfurovum sp.]
MGLELLPERIREKYDVYEWRHAVSILKTDFPEQWNDLISLLDAFELRKSSIVTSGGRKSPISGFMDNYLYNLGWEEKRFDTSIKIDNIEKDTPTHKIDCVKGRVALDIEWNNKDPFYDRDLNNFRLLFDLGAISLGIIITRSDELQIIFNNLRKGHSYGASTTHMGKLLPRINGGGGAGCPILVFGITSKCYNEHA